MQAIGTRVLVLRDSKENKSDGGIILKEDTVPKGTGIVISIGSKVKEVKVGQRIVFGRLDGHDFKIDDKDHVFITEENVQGIF